MANRIDYHRQMEQRMRDLDFRIHSVRIRLADGLDSGTRALLSGELELVAERRDEIAGRLAALEEEPEGTWVDASTEIDQEWDALIQDFEERLGGFC